MYSVQKPTVADNMKNDINKCNSIKIKLISNNFFDIDNLYSISDYIDKSEIVLESVDIGIDKVIKFRSLISIKDILQNYNIPNIMRKWINSDTNRFTLRSILLEDELNFLDLHFEMFYQIETFNELNYIFIRI